MYILLSVGTALAVIFVFFSRRWILRPIHRLIRSADEIRRGNLDLVVAADSRDEIGHLSTAFNAMAASLQEFRRTDQAKLLRIKRPRSKPLTGFPTRSRSSTRRGKVEVATESAQTVFGLKPGALIEDLPFPGGWPGSGAMPGRKGRAASLEGQRSIQQFVNGEERYYRPEAVPILDNERLTTGVILVLKDVTQLQQQTEIKRGVVRTVSHQLNTPLTSVRMAIHLLLGEKVGALNEKQAELLMSAREDSDRLHDILNSLLDLSRFESGKAQMEFRALSPRSIVMDAVESFRRTARTEGWLFHADVAGDLPEIWADTTRIGHVFSNLLSNALTHTSPGGRIALTADVDEAWVRFPCLRHGRGHPCGVPLQGLRALFPGPRPSERDGRGARTGHRQGDRRSPRRYGGRGEQRGQGIRFTFHAEGPTGSRKKRAAPMIDALFVLLTVLFFGLCGLYVRACERL